MSLQKLLAFSASLCAALVLAGCQTYSDSEVSKANGDVVMVSAAPTTAPSAARRSSDDAELAGYRMGDGWLRGRLAYPTGDEATSALLLEKSIPAEVVAGKAYQYDIKVTNLSQAKLDAVEVSESIPGTVKLTEMPGLTMKDGTARYAFGMLAPGESKTARVSAIASGTGSISSCASASYDTSLCMSTSVVAPALKLAISAPEEMLVCETLPVKLTVTNSGSGTARNVRIDNTLPAGMTTADGKSTFAYDVGSIPAGESKDVTFNAKVSKIGKYEQKAAARADDGLHTPAVMASTVAKQPVLEIAKTGPEKVYLGRPIAYDITVKNKGDAIARDTMIVDTIPADAKFESASDNGRVVGGKVQWALGELQPGASKKVTVALSGTSAASLSSQATVQARCADAVSAGAKTEFVGIPALLLECVDVTDPIEIGQNETYIITATNQGTATATNVKMVCKMEDTMQFVSATGTTRGGADGKTITFEPVATIAPKAKAEWKVVVKAIGAGDARFKIDMTADQLTRPVEETESSNFYK